MKDKLDVRRRIAIIGTGISGMAAAWLLNQRHDITVFEQADRIGGHTNTVDVPVDKGFLAVDTGFIVYNEATYPNLTALFKHLEVATQPSDMSFAVSLDEGRTEYSGASVAGLLAQKRNLLRPRFWSMLRDVVRFYRDGKRDACRLDEATTLGAYLDQGRYGAAFRQDHLLPMAAAIWSAPAEAILDFPAASFLRFQENHGLLNLHDRPLWRTVVGGSQRYVERLTEPYAERIRRDAEVVRIQPIGDGVVVHAKNGDHDRFDDVVIATHADQALKMLAEPSMDEQSLLGAFTYSRNRAVLHTDPSFMPRRRTAWASWNHLGGEGDRRATPTVTYWMNALQRLPHGRDVFVTLNPAREPHGILHEEVYMHPLYDRAAVSAQRRLWSLQGRRSVWFCGAYFGAGFHEDGLQAGLAVAETLGAVRRPWHVENESGRIAFAPLEAQSDERAAA